MERQIFRLPENLQIAIEKILREELSLGFQDNRKIAESVLKTSDFYIQNPSVPTPWKEKWCQTAQLCYFLPLNYLRSLAVFEEAQARKFPAGSGPLIDFGSGLGAGSLPWAAGHRLQIMETSSEAQRWHKKILELMGLKTATSTTVKEISQEKNFSVLFSYSLTELKELPLWALQAQNLILIEPSTQSDGRTLLQLRKSLQEKGFSMWAPCTHQQACPLLEKSKTDWCHHRIHIEMPDWFYGIEKYLPIKNSTLTMSYLLASQKPAPATQQWRLVGDQLDEKGKSRQLLCRGPEREFLSWMHRNGEPPHWPRGLLIDPPPHFEQKSNELRILPAAT